MKNKIANFLKLGTLLIGISFLLYSCQKEQIQEHLNNYQTIDNHSEIKRVAINDLLANDNIFNELTVPYLPNKFKNKKAFSKDSINDLIITSDTINIITKENYKSYTIAILRKEKNYDVENLVVEIKNGIRNTYILSYNFDEDWLVNVVNGQSSSPKGTVYFSPLGNSNTLSPKSQSKIVSRSSNCQWISVTVTIPCPCEGHYFTHNCYCSTSPSTNTQTLYLCGGEGGSDGKPLSSQNDGNSPSNGGGSGATSPGGSGAGGTSNTGAIIPFKATFLKRKLQLNLEQYIWTIENPYKSNKIYQFLLNNNSTKAKAYAKSQIKLEIETQNIPWKPSTGIIGNNPNLKFTHVYRNMGKNTSYFKLTDGAIVATSSYEKIDEAGKLIDMYRDNAGMSQNSRYYYIKLSKNDLWAEMLFNPDNLGDSLKGLFAMAGKDLGVNLGRYVLPIEDIKILIDGKDFDGQDVARWKAAGGILLTVVPGGKAIGTGVKLFKPVLIIAGNIKNWNKVIRWGNSTYKLTYKVVFNTITFGDRSQLARILKTTGDVEAHHIIPWAKCKNAVIQAAAKVGFHPNMVQNGLGLKKYTKLIGEGLHGNHPAYDDFVVHRLNTFIKNGFSPESANVFLVNNLIPELKTLIIKAKNTNLNLNEYFKTVVNHSNGIPNY